MSTAENMDDSQQEPTMEEILASIRRIISEDEEEGAGDGEAKAADPEPAAAEPAPAVDDVLELTEKVEDDIEIAAVAEEPEPEAELVIEPEPEPEPVDDIVFEEDEPEVDLAPEPAVDLEDDSPLLEATTAAAAASSFDALSGSLPLYDGEAKTLEEMVQSMLRPMLKQWLDANLAQIVEVKVQEEIERVARRKRGR
ncbi:MAG: DUF2497 domain-containing protein [Pseudomonadota bacterium]